MVETVDVAACAISRVVGDLLVDIVGYSRDGDRLFLGYGYLISEYPLTREVLERREPRSVSVDEQNGDEREASILRQLGYDALLMLPLECEEKAWALVEVYAAGKREFSPDQIALARDVVRRAGVELERLAS